MDTRFARFALFYFCYYAALGAYTPYVSRWVADMGHGAFVVGGMLGLWYATRILGPTLWLRLSGGSARPGRWLLGGAVLTLASFSAFTQTRSALALLAVMAVFGMFYNAILPQFEAMTLTALGPRGSEYGRIRLWGSIGFLLVASSLGWLLDRLGSSAFPWVTLSLLAAMVASAWPHRRDAPPARTETLGDAGHLWRRPGVRRFLLVALLMQVGFGAFYVYYTLHMRAQGFAGGTVGLLWGTGVLIEIAMFWQSPRLLERFGAAPLMSFCLGITALRWTVTALYAGSLPIMLLAQTTHAFSFAIFQASCMRQMVEFFPGHRAAAGQGLLYGFSSGVGGVIGAALATVMWRWHGGQAAFLAAAAVTAIAWLVYALRRPPAPPHRTTASPSAG